MTDVKDDFAHWAKQVNSDNIEEQKQGISAIREILCTPDPPINSVINANVLPKLIQFVSMHLETDILLVIDAVWSLVNLASGQHETTVRLVEAGCIKPLIQMLSHPHELIRENALWGK